MANGCYVYNFKDFLVKSKQTANFGDKKSHSESGQNSRFHHWNQYWCDHEKVGLTIGTPWILTAVKTKNCVGTTKKRLSTHDINTVFLKLSTTEFQKAFNKDSAEPILIQKVSNEKRLSIFKIRRTFSIKIISINICLSGQLFKMAISSISVMSWTQRSKSLMSNYHKEPISYIIWDAFKIGKLGVERDRFEIQFSSKILLCNFFS